MAESLERVGYDCVVATSGEAGAKKIEEEEFDVILTDLKMADMDGLAILRKAKQELPEAEVVVITGHGDVKTAVEAMQAGGGQLPAKAGQPGRAAGHGRQGGRAPRAWPGPTAS